MKPRFLKYPECDSSPDFSGNHYWTIRRAYQPNPPDWGVINREPFPHELLPFRFATVKGLMRRLRELGWKPSTFTDSENKLARVQLTRSGFRVVYFASYSAALLKDKEGVES